MELKSLIIEGILPLILIILIFRFRKRLMLSLIKVFKGRYSYSFLSQYKKIFVRNPYQYCFRDEFIQKLNFIVNDAQNHFPVYHSKENIDFEGFAFGTHLKSLIKEKGEPYCFNAYKFDHPSFRITVAGYRSKMLGVNTVSAYYFMNDSFFMGEYIFKSVIPSIKESLVSHFLGNKEESGDQFIIENTIDRLVHFSNTGFTVDVKYLSKENSSIIKNIEQYFTERISRLNNHREEFTTMIPSAYQSES